MGTVPTTYQAVFTSDCRKAGVAQGDTVVLEAHEFSRRQVVEILEQADPEGVDGREVDPQQHQQQRRHHEQPAAQLVDGSLREPVPGVQVEEHQAAVQDQSRPHHLERRQARGERQQAQGDAAAGDPDPAGRAPQVECQQHLDACGQRQQDVNDRSDRAGRGGAEQLEAVKQRRGQCGDANEHGGEPQLRLPATRECRHRRAVAEPLLSRLGHG